MQRNELHVPLPPTQPRRAGERPCLSRLGCLFRDGRRGRLPAAALAPLGRPVRFYNLNHDLGSSGDVPPPPGVR